MTPDHEAMRIVGDPRQAFYRFRSDPPRSKRLARTVIGDDEAEPVKRTRKRRPSLAAVARQAARAGIAVAGYEVHADGSIRIIVGTPRATDADDDAAYT